MIYFQDVLAVSSLFLVLVVTVFLFQGPYRKYAVLTVYCIASLVTTVAEVLVANFIGERSVLYRNLYWTDEALVRFLEFAMVIALTFRASEGSRRHALSGKLLGIAGVIVVAAPFIFIKHPIFSPSWFNAMSQVLCFCGAILNLGLWTALIANRQRDMQLLMVSAGVGIEVTGQAVAFSLRLLNSHPSRTEELIPNLLLSFSNLLSLLIWFWALRPVRRRSPAPRPVPSTQ